MPDCGPAVIGGAWHGAMNAVATAVPPPHHRTMIHPQRSATR
jgi:hypothetical protein